MSWIDEIKQRARENPKTIILPEAMDSRILKATEEVLSEKICRIVLIGKEEEIREKAKQENIQIDGAQIVNPATHPKAKEYAHFLAEIDPTITQEEAEQQIKNPVYFGMMMIKCKEADGFVSGAMNTTKNILKTAMKIFKKEGTKILSTVVVMVVPNYKKDGKEGVYIFSDCALNETPGYLALSEIAVSSAKTYEKFTNQKAKVAMLSYSSLGSAHSNDIEKVVKATERVKKKHPELIIDGELQLDTAIVPEVASRKAPNSVIQGDANVLIFPDINAGNIGCKLVERLAKAQLFGPICQGLENPINDLSRGCSVESIVGTIVLTAIQAQ